MAWKRASGPTTPNLGDDADTTGAVCGQLAGAWFGESGIPAEWRNDRAGKDQIEPILQRLIQ
jgi:ADP-ribosyl-[dinitrogen reductase] hydrolase